MEGVSYWPLMEIIFVKRIILESTSEMFNWSIEILTTLGFQLNIIFA